MNVVPLTDEESAQLAQEQRLSWELAQLTGKPGDDTATAGSLGLCGKAPTYTTRDEKLRGKTAPDGETYIWLGPIGDYGMTRAEAIADAEQAIRVDPPANLCGRTDADMCAPKCCRDGRGPASGTEDANVAALADEIVAAVRATKVAQANLVRDMDSIEITEPGAIVKIAEALDMPLSILMEAEKITNGQRQKDYGTALDNHQRIARFWNSFLANKVGHMQVVVTAEDVAMMMILMKVARCQNEITADGLIDIAGYANVISKMGPQRREQIARLADEL